jgi:hypothetical protein
MTNHELTRINTNDFVKDDYQILRSSGFIKFVSISVYSWLKPGFRVVAS